jgi:hypothetical protein
VTTERQRRISDFALNAKSAPTKGISRVSPGQSYPQHYPAPPDAISEPLGAPIPIREVAGILGCSAWTVRQRYMPQGLPHFRSGPQGKLVFFRDQVIRWILARQQKGGIRS